MREGGGARCACGRAMRRDYRAESSGRTAAAANCFKDGNRSSALGVPAHRAEEEQERLRRLPGCASVEVDRKGRVVTYSRAQRKRIVKHLNGVLPGGCVDRDE